MKKKLHISRLLMTLTCMGFIGMNTYAKNYTITFTGSGDTTVVGTVTVQNLTQGTAVIVPAGNTLDLYDATNAVNQLSETVETIRVYSNFAEATSTLSFFAKQAGATQISAFSLDGRKVAGINTRLQTGENSFKLSLPKGSYAIQVSGIGYSYTAKVINQSTSLSKPEIVYIGTENPIYTAPQKSKSSSLSSTTMNYTKGDQLLYKGVSGKYANRVSDVPTASKNINFNFVGCTDGDGNTYTTVTIGTQTWMVENMKTTRFRDGSSITNVTSNTSWKYLTTMAWCDYSNSDANGVKYGHLYNWYAVSNTKKIAPLGWHVPTDTEWTRMTDYLSGANVAGGKLKDVSLLVNWASPNTGATNYTGFSALPGGFCNSSGTFSGIANYGYWWTASLYDATNAWARNMDYSSSTVTGGYYAKLFGYSVRCIQDNVPTLSATTAATRTNTSSTTATSGGNVIDDGGVTITARGVCWSTSATPTTDLTTKTIDTGTTGVFSSSMTNLIANTIYYARSYATNSIGTAYGAEICFTSDSDGNVYNIVTIGTQTWMVENLKTIHYRDGSSIANVTSSTTWAALTTGAWCNYANTTANGTKYGHLYNWYAVADSRNIAPLGWHVPTDAEWTTLTTYLGGEAVAGDKLKQAGTINWLDVNYSTNETGFTALPGGYCDGWGGFDFLGDYGNWWSSSLDNTIYPWYRSMMFGSSVVRRDTSLKSNGCSVRCLKD